jgi:concentrative nucleoside transporter, CNT family
MHNRDPRAVRERLKMPVLQSFLGLVVIIFLAWAFSEKRSKFPWRTAVSALLLQLFIVGVMLHLPGVSSVFQFLNRLVTYLQEATRAGTGFVFGYVGGGQAPFTVTDPTSTFILAFQALPLVLVISALSALFYHWRILPAVVRGFAWIFGKSLNTGGAVGVAVSANIFVGMVEAPLFVRPYLSRLTRSELFVVMTSGMATIAGTVLALYAAILQPVIPEAMGHILIASIISVPAAIAVAQIIIPETEEPTQGRVALENRASSAMDAITQGTGEGINLILNITAMLIVLLALVHLVNAILGLLPNLAGRPMTLQSILGLIMAPVTWLMGLPWSEAATAGQLMGVKTILNELVAYLNMAGLPEGALSPRSRIIMIYAMCGFANFGSLGIMIGGLAAMVPERRLEVVSMGFKSILAGTMATCLTGCIVGLWIW